MSSEQSANQLLQGEVDAIFLVASPHSSTVSRLLSSDRVKLMAFERAKAYTSRHKFLSSVTLPQGVIDMQRNIPDRDLNLLAASANLIGHSNLHPAHIDLLLQAATEVHGGGGWFEQNGEFRNLAFGYVTFDKNFNAHCMDRHSCSATSHSGPPLWWIASR